MNVETNWMCTGKSTVIVILTLADVIKQTSTTMVEWECATHGMVVVYRAYHRTWSWVNWCGTGTTLLTTWDHPYIQAGFVLPNIGFLCTVL
jgi:hypothetical protein